MYSQNDEDTKGDVDFDFFDAEETDAGLTRAFKFGENDRQRQQHGSPHSSERDATSSQHDQQSERGQVRIPSAMAYDSDHENDDNISDIEESHQNKKREKINGEKDRSASPSPTTSSKPPKPSNRAKGGKPSSSMNNESDKQKRSSERRQVWGDDSKSDNSYDRRNRSYSHSESDNSDNEDGQISKDRKKQNKKSSTTKQRSNSHSDSDDSYSSNSDYTSDFTDTDSDITDVSPLQSPRKIKTPKTTTTKNEDQHILHSSSAVSDDIREHLVQAKNKGMDLRMLMEAVMELEKEEQDQYARYGHPKSTKKITFDGTANGIPKSHDRKNFSFKDNRVRDIDRENTRLMQEIVQRSTRKQHVPLHTSPLKRVTHSSVNRMKEQRRIELENMVIYLVILFDDRIMSVIMSVSDFQV